MSVYLSLVALTLCTLHSIVPYLAGKIISISEAVSLSQEMLSTQFNSWIDWSDAETDLQSTAFA